jgi:putative ABC transport system ATP-binding protein
MLEIQNLGKSYTGPSGTVRAVDGVSFQVRAGDFLAVQGPSGCGKTTLLLAAGGLLRPSAGRVLLEGGDLYDLPAAARTRLRAGKIGFVFQQFHLVPYLSVLDNVLAPLLALPRRDGLERADELLAQFGLAERRQHVPAQLSTGERQRVALARALLHRPQLLLADEPTGNLDAANGKVVLDHLAQFAKSGGAVVLVTHDLRVAEYARGVLKMRNGKVEA